MAEPSNITCDYLIVGAGVSGLAFADTLLTRLKEDGKSCKLVIVDERDQPGGHWNDAYKFARLHQASAHYGVSSIELAKPVFSGEEPHRATPNELLTYYQDFMEKIMREHDVVYFPMSTVRNGHTIVSLLNPKQEIHVQVQCKVVETSYMSVPSHLSRSPPFEVCGARVVPPNHLSSISVASHATQFVIIGGGRTGIDVVLWLHSRRVPFEHMHWVIPRDHWFICREALTGDAWENTTQDHCTASLKATSLLEMGELCEANGLLCRVDPESNPRSMHGAVVSQAELAVLRRVTNIVRLGHVIKAHAAELILEHGVYDVGERALHVDCTSQWIQEAPTPVPVFSKGHILVQPVGEVMVGPGEMNMSMSAAYIGLVEGLFQKKFNYVKNTLITPVRWPDTLADWLSCHIIAGRSIQLWDYPRINSFLLHDRLSYWSGMSEAAMQKVFAKERVARQATTGPYLAKLVAAHKTQTAQQSHPKVVGKSKARSAEEAKTTARAQVTGTPPTPNRLPH